MAYLIIGLGNPDAEYAGTRHNVGRAVVQKLAQDLKFGAWSFDQKIKALKLAGKIGKEKVNLLLPENFMNNSGASVKPLVKSERAAEKLIVVHDDLDLPVGALKISFNRSAGGHRGVVSIIKNLKTQKFTRVRVGIKSAHPPTDVVAFLMKPFRENELITIKKVIKKAAEASAAVVTDGRAKTMSLFNN